LQPLLGRGFVSAEQVDEARAAKQTAQIGLERARQTAAQARQAITSTKPIEAQLDGARATLALAERDLNKTAVRSPSNGRVTAVQVAAGEFANAGHPLFTIIDTEHWYAIGNFREADLVGIKPGQRATVFVMAQPDLPLRGTVDSLGWGVTSGVSATFGGLPHVERTLNWVRIAARFPVRVLLDKPPEDLMRLGASAVIEIEKRARTQHAEARSLQWTRATRLVRPCSLVVSCVRPPAGSPTACASSSSSSSWSA